MAKGETAIIPRWISHEELANSLTHGFGWALSVAGFVVLLILAALHGSVLRIVSCGVYGFTLILLYTASTLYHSIRPGSWKKGFKVLDHSCIYLLIAGTYTPFTLVVLRGAWGWTLFGLVWGLSVIGILLRVFFARRAKAVSTGLYAVIGWLVVIAIKPLWADVPLHGLLWILAGGLFYTSGIVFYTWQKLPYHHAIWHVFVLSGSACHYFAVLFYVLPAN
jgi:hemolysin III